VDKLRDTMSVFFLDKYSVSVYERSTWPKKIYVCDTGISTIISHTEDTGRKMENIVYLELLRGTNINPMLMIYFYKSHDYEVDFVVKDAQLVSELIQVTYASARDEIDKRETKGLLKAGELLNCKNKTVITWDYEDYDPSNGIRFIPLWKWLIGRRFKWEK